MTTEAAVGPSPGQALGRAGLGNLLAVYAAHFVSHLHILVLPLLFPFFKDRLNVGFVELGLSITVFNVVTAFTQAPMGFIADRIGARTVLVAGLCLGGAAFISLGLIQSYTWLLCAAALAGLANSVYHPADYAIMSSSVRPALIGRVFSFHIFAGYFGGAVAPAIMLSLVAVGGVTTALLVAGSLGLLAAIPVLLFRNRSSRHGQARSAERQIGGAAKPKVLTPAIMALTGFFALLSLSTGGIQNFSIVALTDGYGVPLPVANMALTSFLLASAFGVLSGGVLADKTRRHGEVAAVGFGLAAILVVLVAIFSLGPVLLVLVLGLAGFMTGLVQPSRDMLVRAASPPEAAGRVFGIVSTGFNIGGILGPVLFGWIMDNADPRWIFGAAVFFMLLTSGMALLEERRAVYRRRAAA